MSYLNVRSIDFVKEILENFENFKEEFKKVEKLSSNENKFQSKTNEDKILYVGRINTYMFKIDEKLLDYKENFLFQLYKNKMIKRFDNYRSMSKYHDNLLRKYPCIRQLFYNVIFPKGKINAHYGVNGRAVNRHPDHFRIHITVDPGDNAYFYIDDMPPLHYKKDLVFGFHDGLVKHWAENNGSLPRSVLILDVDKSAIPDNLSIIDHRFLS